MKSIISETILISFTTEKISGIVRPANLSSIRETVNSTELSSTSMGW